MQRDCACATVLVVNGAEPEHRAQAPAVNLQEGAMYGLDLLYVVRDWLASAWALALGAPIAGGLVVALVAMSACRAIWRGMRLDR